MRTAARAIVRSLSGAEVIVMYGTANSTMARKRTFVGLFKRTIRYILSYNDSTSKMGRSQRHWVRLFLANNPFSEMRRRTVSNAR